MRLIGSGLCLATGLLLTVGPALADQTGNSPAEAFVSPLVSLSEADLALWNFNTGAHIRTNPMGFAIDRHQRVAITGGRTLFVFGLE